MNEELVNRSVTSKDNATITCLSEDECKSARADECNQSMFGCPTKGGDCSEGCQNTLSIGLQCCDDTQNCLRTDQCPIPPSIEVCPITDLNCGESENNCPLTQTCVAQTKDCVGETYDFCPIESLNCVESVDFCVITRDDSCNMETNGCMAP